MLFALSGVVSKLDFPMIAVDVSGVSYLVAVPSPLYGSLENDRTEKLILYTFVREDRLELFGFSSDLERSFFAALLGLSGIGPKLALELCSIPRTLLRAATTEKDAALLMDIKGIGRKTAEKLLLDLTSLFERHPEWAGSGVSRSETPFDADAIAALTSLGYAHSAAMEALRKIPRELQRTEDRVAAALRSL